MVAIIERNRDFKFLTNKELLERAKINSKKQGTTLSKALDLFVKQVAITGKINLMSEEELEKERLFRQLQTSDSHTTCHLQSILTAKTTLTLTTLKQKI